MRKYTILRFSAFIVYFYIGGDLLAKGFTSLVLAFYMMYNVMYRYPS